VWYGDDAPKYDHGPRHPLRPDRIVLTRDLIHAYGVVDGARTTETLARNADDDELLLVHTDRYIDVVRRAGHGEDGPWCRSLVGP
jgi:acetoin utilization protein AcuC